MKWFCVSTPWRNFLVPFLALVSVCWLIPSEAVSEQPPAKPVVPAPRPAPELKVFPVKYVKARDLARMLDQVVSGQFGMALRGAIDERTNSVIVAGTPAAMSMAEALISKLDVPSGRNLPPDSVRVFALSHARADNNLSNALRLVLPTKSFEVDPSTNQVVVTGDEQTLETAASLLKRLDTAQSKPKSAEMRVRLVWLTSGPKRAEARKPPEDMKNVVAELAKMGIEEPSLITQTLVTATPDTPFRMEGLAGLDSPYRLSVSGMLKSTPGVPTNRLQISILATPANLPPGMQQQQAANPIGRLETEITAPPGQSVVLGMTPTATSTSVFVVQILPQP